uniref:Ring finger protein 34a n=1 Tax=Sinocyclocheilus grahami TaxID=75366 RepID=A0A672TDJ5_SINGR
MQAGASSMWASCCGLLNEVMGTGAVRGQQPGFGAGAGPFRFAPTAGYSTYPPTNSTSTSLVCQACGQAFSVFRRRHICCDCKKSFCSLCSVLQENLRRCTTCHLLKGTAFQRPQLMRLRVKDLRQYLTLRNINTDTCREKEDLVDLVLCHQGAESEDDPDTPSLQSRPLYSPPPSTEEPTSPLSALSPTQGEPISRSNSSESTNQVCPYTLGFIQDPVLTERLAPVVLKHLFFLTADGCKTQLSNDDSLCRICMDAIIDCVLLECGHMVTCTKCGKRMSECPICRQYVIRAVHVFKS